MKIKRTCEHIAVAIEDEILSGRFKAGLLLRQEDISSTVGYSRIPTREALGLLEGRGLVRRLSTRHIVVANVTDSIIKENMDLFCHVEWLVLQSIIDSDIKIEISGMEQEMPFHTFVIEHCSNEYFRRILSTARDCYIRFAIDGIEPKDKGKSHSLYMKELIEVLTASSINKTIVLELLEQYFDSLAKSITDKKEGL